jgi:hypothetical protein
VAGYQRDYVSACRLHEEALALFRAQGDTLGVAIASGNLGHAAMRLGRLDVAHALEAQSLTLFDEVGDLDGMAESLDRFAMLAVAQADLSRATTLFGAADRVHDTAGTSLPPAEVDELRSEIDAVRARLGDATFEAAWLAGRGMAKDAALALALGPGDSA